MTLCQEKLKGFYGRWLSVFAMLLVGLSFTAGTAKAASGITITGVNANYTGGSGNNTNYTVTVPQYEDVANSVLICTQHEYHNQGSTVTADGNAMTKGFTANQSDYIGASMFYLERPTSNHNYSITTSYQYGNQSFKCYLLSGVDVAGGWLNTYTIPANGFYLPDNYQWHTNINSNPVTKDNPIFSFFIGETNNSSGNITSDNSEIINKFKDDAGNYWNMLFRYNPTADGAYSLNITDNDHTSNWGGLSGAMFEVNPASAVSQNNFVQYLGEDPNIKTTNSSLSYVDKINYNICDGFSSDNDYEMVYSVDGHEVARQAISSSVCSASDYSFVSHPISEHSGTSTISIYSHPYVFGVNTDELPLSDLTLVASSQTFQSVISSPVSNVPYLKPLYNPYIIESSSSSTASIVYNWNIKNTSISSNAYKICLNSYGLCNSITSGQTSGRGNFLISRDNFALDTPIISKLTFEDASSTVLYSSEQFTIVFHSSYAISTSTAETLFGSNTHDLACSAEDWASSNDNWLGFNGTKLKCIALEATYDTIAQINNFFIKILSNLMNKVAANIFPLTIPIRIVESWNSSAYTNLPADIQWLDIADANGNIYYNFPKEWTGGTEDIKIPLWGKAVFGATTSSLLFFNRIRSFMVYVIWAGFAWSFYRLAYEFYDEYMVQKTINDRRKEDYQL